jgi:HK97 family phage portal protein
LTPIPWPNVSVQLLPSGRLGYDVIAHHGPFGGTGLPRRFLAHEVIHLRDRTDDGYIGRSRLSRAPVVLSNALGVQQHSDDMWRQGVSLSGVLETPKKLSDPAYDRLKNGWRTEHAGVGNQRKMAILEDGVTFRPIGIPPEDAEVLNSRRFSVEEIARLYNVPPPLLQDFSRNTFTNSAAAASWFGQFCISPWCVKLEAEFARSVFAGDQACLDFDIGSLMRGDYQQRWAANVAAVNSGILSPNEVRQAEGWNARPDGDVLRLMPGAPGAPPPLPAAGAPAV